MNFKREIIAYHGWAFDRNCWKEWQEILSTNFKFKTYDRGYFGKSYTPSFDNTEKIKIIFAHSFGLHLCPLETLKKANLLILFNSFAQFHPKGEKQRKRSKNALQLMINEFNKNPKSVLESFYKKCYSPFSSVNTNYDSGDWEKLGEDLELLNTSIVDINILKKVPKIYIIQSSKDRIFNQSYAQEFYKNLGDNSQYYEIENIGHSLPFTNIKSCLPMVNQALGEIDNYGT
ncbi:alpha/beta hydrolase [Cyanothece sp. BG0011]|uniref:alpha/beta hydrolase n=1 Tax=Cyanothece sp. BG0011 TaxID=2082950 RepID=UPI000D1E7631|nr:alpha/beta hydrolase [Cyanothece sp. BG0011]